MPTENPHFRDPAYPRGWHGSETTEKDREWHEKVEELLVHRSIRSCNALAAFDPTPERDTEGVRVPDCY